MNPLTRNPAPTAPLAPCPAGGGRCTEASCQRHHPQATANALALPVGGDFLDLFFFIQPLDVTGLAC